VRIKPAIALIALLAVTSAKAQDRLWRLELAASPIVTHYDEDPGVADAPVLIGNSLTVLPLRLELEYDLRHSLKMPAWISLTGELPLASSTGTEAGHMTRNETSYTVQREDVQYRSSNLTAAFGYHILPFLQPFAMAEVSGQATRRINQQNGQEDGSLQPDPDQDYTEQVTAVYLGGGIRSIVPLQDDGAVRIRFQGSYANAQSAEVTNTYFGNGAWGQHTSGYRLHSRLALELPVGISLPDHDSYLSVGGTLRYTKWNGDGRIGREIFMSPWWPRNVRTEWGAFVGLGVFF
jgi:hypothetical protein